MQTGNETHPMGKTAEAQSWTLSSV